MDPTEPVTSLIPTRALLRRLLRRRDELAIAATEHTAHDLPGADLLWQALHEVEERLHTLFPTTWEQRYPDWIVADAARLHTQDLPRPADCRICAQGVQLEIPPQAS